MFICRVQIPRAYLWAKIQEASKLKALLAESKEFAKLNESV